MMDKLSVRQLRIGDEVYFTAGMKRVIGVVEKVNKKSVKVRQTNDVSWMTKSAFGHPSRRKGGCGRLWTCGADNAGQTSLYFTEAHAEKVSDTARGAEVRRAARTRLSYGLGDIVREMLNVGCTREDVTAVVERQFELRGLNS